MSALRRFLQRVVIVVAVLAACASPASTDQRVNCTSDVGISLSPNVVHFGNVRVGEVGERLVSITNNSVSHVSGSIVATAYSSPFTVTNGGGAFVLAPGETRVAEVQFEPTAAGCQNESVLITIDGGSTNTSMQLTGNGVIPTGAVGQIDVIVIEPAELNFDKSNVGQTLVRTITIRNPSPTTQLVGNVGNPSSPFFVHDDAAGRFSLAPNETHTVMISYTPLSSGSFNDNLIISYTSDILAATTFVRLNGDAAVMVSGTIDERLLTGDAMKYRDRSMNLR